MVYRAMEAIDYDNVLVLWESAGGDGVHVDLSVDSREAIERILARGPGLSQVCEEDGRVIGTALCGHDGRRGYLYHVVVSPEYRRRGVATELIERSLDKLRGEGMAKCHLFVFRTNESAALFYEGTGWTRRDDLAVFSKGL